MSADMLLAMALAIVVLWSFNAIASEAFASGGARRRHLVGDRAWPTGWRKGPNFRKGGDK